MTDYKALCARSINDLAQRKKAKKSEVMEYIVTRQTGIMRQQWTKRNRYVIGQV